VRLDANLAAGLNVCHGKLACPAVGAALNLPVVSAESCLGDTVLTAA